MKTAFLSLLCLMMVSGLSAQTKKTSTKVKEDADILIYSKALRYGDAEVARCAIYRLMIAHPEEVKWLDSLVILYSVTGQHNSCIQAGMDYLRADSTNEDVLQRVALASSSVGKTKEALDIYTRLYRTTGKIQYAYQLAVHNYILQRIGESDQMADIVIKDPAAAKETIWLAAANGQPQDIPLLAAAWNLRGLLFRSINKEEKAAECFGKAIEIAPDYAAARENMEVPKSAAEQVK